MPAIRAGSRRTARRPPTPPTAATPCPPSSPARSTAASASTSRPKLKAVAGLFDLSRPYFGFDDTNRFVQIGTTRSCGAEFSLSGNVTDQLTLVAGGVLLDARVRAGADAAGTIGRRPVGMPGHIFSVDANWDAASLVRGLSFDAALVSPRRNARDNRQCRHATRPRTARPRHPLSLQRRQDPCDGALPARQSCSTIAALSSAGRAPIFPSERGRLRPI